MGNGDYAAIITPRHFARLQHLLDEAQAQGAVVRQVAPAGEGSGRQMPPTLVTRAERLPSARKNSLRIRKRLPSGARPASRMSEKVAGAMPPRVLMYFMFGRLAQLRVSERQTPRAGARGDGTGISR